MPSLALWLEPLFAAKKPERTERSMEQGMAGWGAQTLLSAAGLLAAATALAAAAVRAVKWFMTQRQQSEDIASLKEEQCLLTYGLLACLKGLREQGCDGPVSEAIEKIEKHINRAAHGQCAVKKEGAKV